jgi:hypothetical protein
MLGFRIPRQLCDQFGGFQWALFYWSDGKNIDLIQGNLVVFPIVKLFSLVIHGLRSPECSRRFCNLSDVAMQCEAPKCHRSVAESLLRYSVKLAPETSRPMPRNSVVRRWPLVLSNRSHLSRSISVNDVIEYRDTHYLPSLSESIRDLDVLSTWLWVARWMVVRE